MLPTVLLFGWIGLPLIAWSTNLLTGKRIHPALLYVIAGIAGYCLLLVTVWAVDIHLKAEMNSFDIDGDGSISGPELTPAAEKAMDEWASDTGRSFAPVLGVPLTAIWYAMVLGVLLCGEWIFRSLFFRKDVARPKASETQVSEPSKSDNPFEPPSV